MGSDASLTVKDLMSARLIVVNEDDSLPIIMTLFERCQISGAPVINGKDDYVGVISKTDFATGKLLKLLRHKRLEDITAGELMNPSAPVVVLEDSPLMEAVSLMQELKLHRVFVKDKDTSRLIGVLSAFDVMRAVNVKPVAQDPAAEPPATAPAEPQSSRDKISDLIMRKQREVVLDRGNK